MKILAFSGRKESGKDFLTKFLIGNASFLFGERIPMSLSNWDDSVTEYQTTESVTTGTFAMAEELKKCCINLMGLDEKLVYGTNEEKEALTRYQWEDMPHYLYISRDAYNRAFHESYGQAPDNFKDQYEYFGYLLNKYLPTGYMTYRQVLQEMGTGVFRRMWSDIHNQACLRNIRKANKDVSFIVDVRFTDEIEAVQKAGGKVIRLTRCPHPNDMHASETSLDKDKFNWSKFDYILDNANMDIPTTKIDLLNTLYQWGWLNTKGAEYTKICN